MEKVVLVHNTLLAKRGYKVMKPPPTRLRNLSSYDTSVIVTRLNSFMHIFFNKVIHVHSKISQKLVFQSSVHSSTADSQTR